MFIALRNSKHDTSQNAQRGTPVIAYTTRRTPHALH